MSKYEVHPLANLFPMMNEKTHEGLKQDIKANGQIEPIIIYKDEDGKKWLLDGRNRENICLDLGIKPKYRIVTQEEIPSLLNFIISLNLHRRHMTDYERAMFAARTIPLQEKEAKERMKKGTLAHKCARGKTSQKVAKLLNVKPRSVENARKVLKTENQQLIAKVDSGLIPISLASKIVTNLSQDEQEQIIDKPKKEIIQTINKKLDKKSKPYKCKGDKTSTKTKEQAEQDDIIDHLKNNVLSNDLITYDEDKLDNSVEIEEKLMKKLKKKSKKIKKPVSYVVKKFLIKGMSKKTFTLTTEQYEALISERDYVNHGCHDKAVQMTISDIFNDIINNYIEDTINERKAIKTSLPFNPDNFEKKVERM